MLTISLTFTRFGGDSFFLYSGNSTLQHQFYSCLYCHFILNEYQKRIEASLNHTLKQAEINLRPGVMACATFEQQFSIMYHPFEQIRSQSYFVPRKIYFASTEGGLAGLYCAPLNHLKH